MTKKIENQNPLSETDGVAEWKEENTAVTATTASAPLEASDFIIPTLNLVQKSGELSEYFSKGTWVLNKELQVTKEVGEPLTIIVLSPPSKFYMEHLPFDPTGPKPRFFNTLEEVQDAGLTTEWDNVNNIRPSADRAARITILIKEPESLGPNTRFNVDIVGLGRCAMASYLVVNTAYRNIARRLFTAARLDIGDKPFSHMRWTLSGLAATQGGYSFFAPRIAPNGWLDDASAASLDDALKALV